MSVERDSSSWMASAQQAKVMMVHESFHERDYPALEYYSGRVNCGVFFFFVVFLQVMQKLDHPVVFFWGDVLVPFSQEPF